MHRHDVDQPRVVVQGVYEGMLRKEMECWKRGIGYLRPLASQLEYFKMCRTSNGQVLVIKGVSDDDGRYREKGCRKDRLETMRGGEKRGMRQRQDADTRRCVNDVRDR